MPRPMTRFTASCAALGVVASCAFGAKVVSTTDAGTDAPVSDAGVVTYNDMTNAANWTFFDTTTVDPNATGYFGSAFDGRYVYFSPVQETNGIALEYDTQASFGAAKSWSTFVLGNDAGGGRFVGAAYDSRYLYYPPFNQSSPTMARYDTQGTYTSASSWTMLDISNVVTSAGASMVGAVFAGGHVYLPPYNNSVVLSYDTTGPFAIGGSWSSFDASALIGASFESCGGAWDGRYVYFAPFAGTTASGLVLRYDSTMAFTTAGSWSTFDATTVDPNATAFEGAVFDGRYVYLVPSGAAFTSGLAIRYDTTSAFTGASSWAKFDMTTLNPNAAGFVGGAFDGRYVYYVPYGTTTGTSGVVARFDTTAQAGFTSPSAWQTINLVALDPNASGYSTAAFDGRYLYLSPNLAAGEPGHVVARFDARTPPGLPTTYFGSFF
jgi:hypothetical protein